MLPSTCVVVPTYWTRPGLEARPGDAVYDHPTPLDGEGTLDALLESLNKLDTSCFYLLLLVAVTGEDVARAAEERVCAMAEKYPDLMYLVFGVSHLPWLHDWLGGRGLTEATEYLGLRTYPRIRNLQLALPLSLGSSAIVALDDDEIVVEEGFLHKASEPLGSQIDGRRVDGLSGHYLQEDGSVLLRVDPEKAHSANLFDRKASIMNAATDALEAMPGNIVETPFCYGGNMEFSPDLAASVGFDPEITRGEDIDYLINARIEGKRFFLRKDLNILHCPPKGGSYKDASLSKLEQDVIRFIYEKEKLRASQEVPDLCPVTAEDLMPYPGEFLSGDIEEDACTALRSAGYPGDERQFVQKVRDGARAKVLRYLSFRQQWPVVTEALSRDSTVCQRLMRDVRGI
jgi:hypothetical protein